MSADLGQSETIGPYRVVRKLGEGGMGMVFEALHEAIQRRVAIKMLHASLAKDKDLVTRFFNEARAVNLIGHPGLVQVSDLGHLPDGSAYLVMELLAGESLAQRLERLNSNLPVAEALQFAWQIADSVAAAHAKGIIHRDLKPANVMLVPDSHVAGGERTKLLDFGLAKVTQQAGGLQVKTKGDAVLGTPLYMSPEQCQGAGGVDEKTDVYALGAMLYEMLAGRPPFTAATAAQLLGMHMFKEPEPLRNLVPEVPKRIAEYVHRLLAKKKEQRPTMLQVAAQLESLIALAPPLVKKTPRAELPAVDGLATTQPGTAAPTTGPAPAKTTLRTRKRNGWLLVGILSAAGLAGGALIVRSGSRPASPAIAPTPISGPAPVSQISAPDMGDSRKPVEDRKSPQTPDSLAPSKPLGIGIPGQPKSPAHLPVKAGQPGRPIGKPSRSKTTN